MKIIYNGSGLCPPIYLQNNKEGNFYGWLFVRHPDGQLVSIANIKKECEDENLLDRL